MKISLDKDADVAYIYFKEVGVGEVEKTISLNNSISVDLDSDGRTVGIEIINASKNLPVSAFNAVVVT